MIDIISFSGCIIIIIVMCISCKCAMRDNRVIRHSIIIPIHRIHRTHIRPITIHPNIEPVQILLESSKSKNVPIAEIV